MAEKRKTTTKYQRLQKAASTYCSTGSSAAKERFKKASEAYVADAMKKGKSKSEAAKVVSRLSKCPKK